MAVQVHRGLDVASNGIEVEEHEGAKCGAGNRAAAVLQVRRDAQVLEQQHASRGCARALQLLDRQTREQDRLGRTTRASANQEESVEAIEVRGETGPALRVRIDE